MKKFLTILLFTCIYIIGCKNGNGAPPNVPHADAGLDKSASVNDKVTLSGAASTDPENDSISFAWEITAAPIGSEAALINANTVAPYFTPDIEGIYTICLTVTDGTYISEPDCVTITAQDNKYPGMKFVKAGYFYMGTDYGNADEGPIHLVYLDSYFMDINEVTVASYRACVEAFECLPPYKNSSLTRGHYFDNTDFDNYPILNVTYEDANRYCEYVGKLLPTEAMWEKAARGETLYYYPWGNDAEPDNANYDNVGEDTTYVGRYASGVSVYGMYDMAGNAAEWVADYYDDDYYESSSSENPQGPMVGEFYVIRGGHFASDQFDIRTVARDYFSTQEASDYIGFRCAKELE